MQQTADEVREIAREPRGFDWVLLGLHRASFDHKKSLLAALYRSDFFLRKARRALAHVRGKQKGSGVVSTTGANLEPAGRK
jgi:hypothetical protein